MRCINCMREWNGGGACPHCGFDAAKYKPPNDALPPDSVLNGGKYVVGRVLGRGGFGITYVALDRNLGLRVAIKECLPQRDARRDADGVSAQWLVPVHEQERARDSFLREAKKMAEIYGIPGVVPVREYFDDNKTTYIVMDYVEGETLAQRLRRTGSWSARECFRLLSPVMDTLAQAHKLQIEGEDRVGVIHRDIKPNNIIIGRIKGGKERVWLLDLGAAKDLGARDFAPNVSVESRPVGTPGYAPPEQGTNKGSIGPWTDVYAMSATFIYCMTGKKPPDSQSRASEMQTPEILLSVPGPLGDVLRKGMALHREERYQSMKELRDALEKAVNDTADTREYEDKTEVSPIAAAPELEAFKPKAKTTKPEKAPSKKAKATPKKSRSKRSFKKAWLMIMGLVVIAFLAAGYLYEEYNSSEIKTFLLHFMPASGKCGENAHWTLNADGALIIDGTGDMKDYNQYFSAPWRDYHDIISSVTISSGITSVGAYAFYEYYEGITNVIISDSVKTINKDAFVGCKGLTTVPIPNSVTAIHFGAFAACSGLTKVIIPDGVTTIGEKAFYRCTSLTSVWIPDSVTKIGEEAFNGCTSLKSVEIPDSVTEIGKSAFLSLERVSISENTFFYDTRTVENYKPVLNISDYEITPNGQISLKPRDPVKSDDTFSRNVIITVRVRTSSAVESVELLNLGSCGEGVEWMLLENGFLLIRGSGDMSNFYQTSKNSIRTKFQPNALNNLTDTESISNVKILEGVSSIGTNAFRNYVNLQWVEIPDSVTEIRAGAFIGCSSLKSVSVSAETTILKGAFDENTTVTRR